MPRKSAVRIYLRRAFVLRSTWTTRDLMEWSHPRADWGSLRDRCNRCRAIRRAADKITDRVTPNNQSCLERELIDVPLGG
jgi:uncharacterized cysteine cluster protein YcgN (CxxCxxCC family)